MLILYLTTYRSLYVHFKILYNMYNQTRKPAFIKAKLKKTDDQTNIDHYGLAANITEYYITSKLNLQRLIITNFCGPVSHLR